MVFEVSFIVEFVLPTIMPFVLYLQWIIRCKIASILVAST